MSLSPQNEFKKIWLLTGQLTLSEPSEHGGEFAITSFPFEVGRRPDAACSLSSSEVSNYHAEIFQDEDGLAVRDLGSTNGTYINGRRIEESSLHLGDLLQFADVIFRVQQWEQGSNEKTIQGKNYSQALALMEFDQLIKDRSVVPFFQPIHSIDGEQIIGYEVLAQSHIPEFSGALDMFRAAAHSNVEADLSRMFRWEGLEQGGQLPGSPRIFLNTRPVELENPAMLIESLQEMRQAYADTTIVLEINEAAVAVPEQMSQLYDALQDIGIRVAYDDFGAGQARLLELTQIPPEYLKFDIQLIHEIDRAPKERRQVLSNLVRMAREIDVKTIAEGVERAEEREICEDLGIEYGQGYLFGRPAPLSTWS